jgi:hypothetical protein
MAFESPTPPFYTGASAERNRVVDEAARQWSLELETASVAPEVTVGTLITAGSSSTNYFMEKEGKSASKWSPAVETIEGRSLVRLTKEVQPVFFGAEGLIAGITNAMKMRNSESLGNEGMQLVPYPRFDNDGTFSPTKTRIIALSDNQVEDLRMLLGMGPSDPHIEEFAKRMGWDKK